MKHFSRSNLAGLGVLLLALCTAPVSFPGQTTAPKPESPQSPAVAPNSDQHCINLDSAVEQLGANLRNMALEGKLANLSQQLAKEEAVMSSPEMAKLQNLSAQLEGKLEEKSGE